MVLKRRNWNVNLNFWNRRRVTMVSWFYLRVIILLLLDLNSHVFCFWKCGIDCELKKFKCKKLIVCMKNLSPMVSWIVVWSCLLCVLNVLKLISVVLMMFILLAKWKFKCVNLIFRNGFDRWWWALITWFWLFY